LKKCIIYQYYLPSIQIYGGRREGTIMVWGGCVGSTYFLKFYMQMIALR